MQRLKLLDRWARCIEHETGFCVKLVEKEWELNPAVVGGKLHEQGIPITVNDGTQLPPPSAIETRLVQLGILKEEPECSHFWKDLPNTFTYPELVLAATTALGDKYSSCLVGSTPLLGAGGAQHQRVTCRVAA